jgi:hypothetical protein
MVSLLAFSHGFVGLLLLWGFAAYKKGVTPSVVALLVALAITIAYWAGRYTLWGLNPPEAFLFGLSSILSLLGLLLQTIVDAKLKNLKQAAIHGVTFIFCLLLYICAVLSNPAVAEFLLFCISFFSFLRQLVKTYLVDVQKCC